jgi:hypothetical protein
MLLEGQAGIIHIQLAPKAVEKEIQISAGYRGSTGKRASLGLVGADGNVISIQGRG